MTRRKGMQWTPKQRAKFEANQKKRGNVIHKKIGDPVPELLALHENLISKNAPKGPDYYAEVKEKDPAHFPCVKRIAPPLTDPFEEGGRACSDCGRLLDQVDSGRTCWQFVHCQRVLLRSRTRWVREEIRFPIFRGEEETALPLPMEGDCMTLRVIYEPKGRAKEYADLAVNLYRGCDHGCTYCYAPAVLRITREEFMRPVPRKNVLALLEKDADELSAEDEKRSILLCFTCDPYQMIEMEGRITRKALEILLSRGLNVTILTKGGYRSLRDIDLWRQYPDQITYATTLVFADIDQERHNEPHTDLSVYRILALSKAHDVGLKTWVSLEPVIDPVQTLDLIRMSYPFVDLYKVGTLNHAAPPCDYQQFGKDVVAILKSLGKEYYLKEDLRRLME